MANVKSNILDLNQVYTDLNKTLDENIKRLNTGAVAIERYNKVVSIKPSEYAKGLEEISTKTKQLEDSQKKIETQVQKTRLAEIKLQQDREKAFDKHEANLKKQEALYQKEQARLEASANVYNKVQTKLTALNKEYSDLATKKALGIKLSFQEEKRVDFLSQKIQKYDQTLKAVDATMGKYQRNVGNYASALGSSFNPLSNSIQQLTREMPAFTYSVQTGFMAISNNLPIFFDAVNGIIDQNKQLRAQGQPTKNVLKEIAGAFFGWGTALSVGITLLTVYGKEISEFLFGSEKKKKAIEAEKKALEEKNNVEKKVRDQQVSYANDELTRANILLSTARNLRLSNEERIKAVDELQKRYPDYLGNLSKEEILAGKTAIAEAKLTDALMKRAIFLGLQDKIKETTKNLVEAEIDYNKAQQKTISNNSFYSESEEKKIKGKQKVRSVTEDEIQTLKYLQNEEKEYQKRLKTSGSEMMSNEAIRRQKKITTLEELQGLFKLLQVYEPYNKVVNENTNTNTKNTASKKEQTKSVEELLKGTEAWYNSLISDLKKEQSTLADSTEQYKIYADAIAEVEKQLNLLKNGREKLTGVEITPIGGNENGNELEERLKAETEALIELNNNTEKGKELMKQYADEVINAFGMDLINNSGLTNFFDLIENGLDRFGENWEAKTMLIMEATQEMFNFISGLSQANFDEEYEREARRKETALLFAGESAEARAEIERESERRTREIRKREAKAQRSQAMFNIGIDTAQAIMRAWATNPKTAPFMTAIIAGVGIAQIAAIASRPLPEFWKGTDNAPEGLALTQERGREIITDAKGVVKSWGSDNGAQLTHLNKGDKVLKHSDTMRELNNIMAVNNILPPKENIINFAPIERKLDKLTGAILNKESFKIISDSNGKRYFEQKNGQNRELKNARLEMKQRNV
jgi:hypothetical protein